MSSKLQLKKDDSPDETMTCPGCGAPLPVDAVLCVQCGYDTRAGRRIGEDGKKKSSPLLIGILAVAIVAAIAVVLLRSRSSSTSSPPAPVAPAPISTSPAPALAVAPAVSSTVTATDAAVNLVATSAPTTVAVAETPVDPEKSAIDWAAVEAEQLERATAELDRRAPPYEAGESIELRLTNGIVQRGEFKGIVEGEVVLEIASNEVRQLSLESLDRGSRVRAEPAYRERYIEYFVRQRVTEMRRSETNAP